eukprot:1133399-Karenia_brevis.AAC.1
MVEILSEREARLKQLKALEEMSPTTSESGTSTNSSADESSDSDDCDSDKHEPGNFPFDTG